MTDILSLTAIDLRKEVAKAQGYKVKESHVCTFANLSGMNRREAYRYSLQKDGKEVAFSLVSAENVLPPLDLVHAFPLVHEMNEWGWGVYIESRPDALQTVIIEAETDKAIRKARCRYYEVGFNTDPSDALAKCYLLVRKEMGV